MFNSVRSRLLMSSLLVSLVTILSVGVVTLFLVNAYFGRQERDHLQSQAELFSPTMTQALLTDNVLELRREVALISYASQMRVQVRNAQGELLADSGEQELSSLSNPITVEAPDVVVGVVVDESGRVVRLSPPVSRQNDADGAVGLSLLEPSRLFGTRSSFVAVSQAKYRTPLVRDGQTWGFLELSQGPAVGEPVISDIRLALAGGSLVALLIAASIGLLAAGQITRPLFALGRAVEAMSDDDLAVRAPGSRLLEFNRLANQFNTMADRLARTIERLKTEREGLRRMIADASHELKTPLTALKTFNSLLREELKSESAAVTFLRESENQINQLDRLTSGMLDLSRFEARLSGTNFISADLRTVIDGAVQALRPFSEERGHNLAVHVPDQPIFYRHDSGAMQRAVGNILHNAIKFTPAGGNISLRLEVSDMAIQIAVQDDGPGIPADVQPRIFDRFYHHPALSQSGSGLGLAICREIVAIHQGQVLLRSGEGQGSTFTIVLQLASGSGQSQVGETQPGQMRLSKEVSGDDPV